MNPFSSPISGDPKATITLSGDVKLATDAVTVTGTSDLVVTTPGNITAKMSAPGAIGNTTPGSGAFTSLSGTSLNVQDGAITNVSDIALDTITSDDATKPFILNATALATDGVLIGNKTAIGTWAGDGVSSIGTANITDVGGAAHGLSLAVGDLVHISAATTASHKGFYRVVSDDGTTVAVDRTLAATDTDLTVTFYKDVIGFFATDGTNGQRITGYSHQDKPLQIGGDTLIATSGMTSEDVTLAGVLNVDASNGRVGIGTTAPTQKLDVNGVANFSDQVSINGPLYVIGGGGVGIVQARTGVRLGYNEGAVDSWIDHQYSDGGVGFKVYGAGTIKLNVNDTNTAVLVDSTGNVKNVGAAITVGSGDGITVDITGNLNRQLYKVTTTYAAYTDADTTKGIVIATLPAKMKIVGFYADTTAAYTGGTTNAATMVVGITAESAAEIIASHNVFAGAILAGDADADMGTSMTRAAAIQGGYMPSWTGTTAIYATLVIVNDILSNLTAGSTTFYIETEQFQ